MMTMMMQAAWVAEGKVWKVDLLFSVVSCVMTNITCELPSLIHNNNNYSHRLISIRFLLSVSLGTVSLYLICYTERRFILRYYSLCID